MWLYKSLFLILVLEITNGDDKLHYIDETVLQFANEIGNWVTTGQESPAFQYFLDNFALPTSLQYNDWRSFTGDRNEYICTACRSVVATFMSFHREGMPINKIKSYVVKLCTKLNFAVENVCEGVVTLNLPTILYIINAKPDLTSSTICGVILESDSCPLINDEYNWTINIDSRRSDKDIHIVQITDIHYDPKYEPYGNSNCKEPMCCRKGQNNTNNTTTATTTTTMSSSEIAGYWGDYNKCDSPWHAIIDALHHIKATHQNISHVYFTGDVIDHGIWELSREGNIESFNKNYVEIYNTFKDIPVYPILGNHEPCPLNVYAPTSITNDEIGTQWLYNMTANLWIKLGWLPESTRSTIQQGGFYTLSPRKGFRIIALNNNVCYVYNWWLWYQPKDPDGQLQWLADTLLQAEKDNEFVHILAHIPANDKQCQTTWRREYLKIVNRYAHIITAQFNGHSHNDELVLFFSNDSNSKINNVAWNAGSITTYANLNPNYKVYNIDSKNYAVKNFENWMYNLTLANENPAQRPSWYKSYSFKEEYNISDLTYNSLSEWLFKLGDDETLLTRYYRHFFKHAEPSLRNTCNTQCMKTYMCRIIASLGDHETHCNLSKN